MKSSVKDLIWMCVVMFYTLVWDAGYIATIIYLIQTSKDWLIGVVFGLVFSVLTGLWNFVSIRAFIDALKAYKAKK